MNHFLPYLVYLGFLFLLSSCSLIFNFNFSAAYFNYLSNGFILLASTLAD